MTKALLLVDVQNDYFPGGAMPLEDMDRAAANAARPQSISSSPVP